MFEDIRECIGLYISWGEDLRGRTSSNGLAITAFHAKSLVRQMKR